MGGMDVYIYVFFKTALVWGDCQHQAPAVLQTEKQSSLQDWVGPRLELVDKGKLKFLTPPGIELIPFSREARKKSLYWLSYRSVDIYNNKRRSFKAKKFTKLSLHLHY